MEVKVFAEGIQRVVCGVTEDTTCQAVVVALAQALGQPGRYTLREKFKDFERCMTPNELLLDTLERYGEQARDVQLILVHNGPCVWDPMSRAKVGRYQPCPPLRRKDGRMRRGSGSLSLHRQSLPSLCSSKNEAEANQEEVKRPKRKSLTLMEEAWDWLESLGRGKVYSTHSEKESSRKMEKKNRFWSDAPPAADRRNSDGSSRGKARGQKGQQTTCCIGSQTRSEDNKHSRSKSEQLCPDTAGDQKDHLMETIISQLKYLQGLQLQVAHTHQQIVELEGKQEVCRAEQEARKRLAEEEMEQIQFWENELKSEEAFEKDLLRHFMNLRAKAVESKVKLDEYRHRLDRLEFFSSSDEPPRDINSNDANKPDMEECRSDPDEKVNVNRKFLPEEDQRSLHAPVPVQQIRERRPTGPTELREWWTRWSQAQSSPTQSKKKVIHRSELTIYLSSTKV